MNEIDVARLKETIMKEMKQFADRSISEAEVIVEAMKRHNIKQYVDLGCWAGTLAKDVWLRHDCDMLLIDGCSVMLEMAKEHFDESSYAMPRYPRFEEAAVLPINWGGLRTMAIPFNSTGSSTILPFRKELGESPSQYVVIAPKKFMTILDLEKVVFLQGSYIKMDLEGIDHLIVDDILRFNIPPKGLDFEFHDLSRYNDLASRLNDYYHCPLLIQPSTYEIPLEGKNVFEVKERHQFYSISMTKDSFVLLGMNPDKVYYHERN